MWIMVAQHNSHSLTQHNTPSFTTIDTVNSPWFTITCSAIHTMINNHWYSKTHLDSKSLPLMLYQRLWIMASYTKPVDVNHGVLCGASGCESWCVLLSQWCITHYDSHPLAQQSSPWLTTTCSALHTMIHNQLFRITHHDSQSLAQDYTPWFTTTGSA
jgi:hypothetical protein